jgi:hypothetical protein
MRENKGLIYMSKTKDLESGFRKVVAWYRAKPKESILVTGVVLAVVIVLLTIVSMLTSWRRFELPSGTLGVLLPEAPAVVGQSSVPGLSLWSMQTEDIAVTLGSVTLTSIDDPAQSCLATINYVQQAIANNPMFDKSDFKLNRRRHRGKDLEYLTGFASLKDESGGGTTYLEGLFHTTPSCIGFVYAHYSSNRGRDIWNRIAQNLDPR